MKTVTKTKMMVLAAALAMLTMGSGKAQAKITGGCALVGPVPVCIIVID
jgi:uncharacterized membrane protein